MARATVLLSAALASFFGSARSGWSADLSRERFLVDYRAAVERLHAASREIHVEGVLTNTSLSAKTSKVKLENRAHVSLTSSGGCQKLRIFNDSGRYVDRVMVACGGQGFVVRSQSTGSPYFIERDAVPGSFLAHMARTSSVTTESMFSIYQKSLHDFVKSKSFSVEHVSEVEQNGETLVKMEFKHALENVRASHMSGWVLLDPSRSLAIREYDVNSSLEVQGPGGAPRARSYHLVGRIQYSDEKGIARPTDVLTEMRVDDTINRSIFQPTRWDYGPTPSEKFTLAAYGLGELERPPGRPTNRFALGAILIAAVALAIGLFLKYLSLRARKPSAVSSP